VETALEVLDRLEAVLRRHLTRLPAAQRHAIEREVIGLLQMARAALPRELHQATRLLQDAEGTVARAREEARRMVLDAQSHARALGEAPASLPPSARAQAMLDDARREADRVRRGADEYAASVLERLAGEVDRVLATIRRGQDVLRGSSPPASRRDGG
jgi:cell division septum initiation protein DivIVA